MALGLGEISLDSYLNEPLKAQVDLLNIGGLHEDQIRIRLATSEDFKKMGVDRAYFLTSISFDVEIDDNGRARILISSEDPVLEPYLDFILEARWPSGRLLREYTVLVDPPVFDSTTPVVSASSRVAQVDGEPEPAKKNSAVASSSSGTRVDVRDSDLAPGQMPSRAFNATTAPAPASGTRYMIHRDDTLWRIASSARPPGASVHQTMLDIQRLNPDAFIDGNINKIKAGYIIYLPTQAEISSGDASQALAEVRSQNEAWREGRASEPDYGSGPSLRISAEPEDGAAAGSAAATAVAANTAAMEDIEKAGLERVELEERLASMEQQVETLQRIVSLKDDQIAALQGVLADKQDSGDGLPAAEARELEALEGEVEEAAAAMGEPAPGSAVGDGLAVQETIVEETPVVEVEEVTVAEAPAQVTAPPQPATPASTPAQDSPGFFSNLWFVLGAIVLALLGILFMRRRGKADEGIDEEPVQTRDVFADVELADQNLEVEEAAGEALKLEEETVAELDDSVPGSRGYGQRKHDEYVSDEASDALAEAEIYIAYGRYPQAIELLRNALVNDPDNAAYRLKLLQLYMETGNRPDAMQQLAELESIGDAERIAAGREALGGGEKPAPREDFATEGSHTKTGLLEDVDDTLESDFSDLEIEEAGQGIALDDELDLSADFEDSDATGEPDEEDLLIAAESNGLSTKLDLARAYMDMGDEDGAPQILEEVAAEGNEEIRAEARALLERIG